MTSPSFEEALNRRQKARAAGLDPNHWYAVEYDAAIRPGQVNEVQFWGESLALYRGQDGGLHALENRCAHRQLKLSLGTVDGKRLVCAYHGWGYDGDGCLAEIKHELFGHRMPQCRVQTYPLRVRYGLVWIFFGDPGRAATTPMPEIPELEGPHPWACVPLDYTWNAHHSMIIDNVSDFTHAHLHRRYKPFTDAKLTKLEAIGDKVHLAYDTKVGRGRISGLFVDRRHVNTDAMTLCYEYPYQWSNTGDQIKHWCFVLPISPKRTRTFFLFYFKSFKVPLLPARLPRALMEPLLRAANRLHIGPLLAQDGVAVEAEQEGYDRHYDRPVTELNPAVHAFQALTVRKWQEYLDRINDGREARGALALRLRNRGVPTPAPQLDDAE